MAITILLRLSGPMQSYGQYSLWEHHDTAPRPTKSAVAGIVANALGRELDTDMSDLAAMTFAVRADRPGQLAVDDQTVGGGTFPLTPIIASRPKTADNPHWYGVPRRPERAVTGGLMASHTPSFRKPVLVTKQHIVDGAFLAGLTTHDHALAQEAIRALRHPARLLSLGRRAYPPAHPIGYSSTELPAQHWPTAIPLLPEASTPHPRVWTESPPGPGLYASPEQVPYTFAERDHRLMHLHLTHVTPPAVTEDPS
ncbi:type I-E CRISPR-associated protein Cas5/CasD [Streptomyces sp. 8L]|uniref:type I-E CRISPR-associated protein Cas5/CasD n=1 Tax=Streptomyces sp. 8L TaxID=2877242 RepID=UPI001CD390BC|nr:type I-E CRISPR-associated protein Cas5/CasD [Streptomyces sp. 8L]MCA1222559.1 type I-E CRISPR-associated protein Cas5/CasD [Streptomyces sp. 8L]